MHIESQEWAIRPAGAKGWMPIDPDSPIGRLIAAQFGFTTTTPQKERVTMTAIPVETVHLRTVKNDTRTTPEALGLLPSMKEKAAAAFAWIASMPERAMGWAKRIVPDSVVAKAAAAWGWTKAKTIALFRLLGKTGLAGAAMLTVSTADGRRLLSLLAKPFIWADRILSAGWNKVESALFVENPTNALHKVRNFISERMADVRIALFGDGTQENRYGFLGNLAIKTFLKVGPFLMLDSKTMLVTRGIGAALFGAKLFTLAALLPVAGWIVFAAQAFIVMGTFVAAGDPLLRAAEKVTGIRVNATKREGTQAAKVAATVTDIPVKSATPAQAHRQPQRSGGKPSARTR